MATTKIEIEIGPNLRYCMESVADKAYMASDYVGKTLEEAFGLDFSKILGIRLPEGKKKFIVEIEED